MTILIIEDELLAVQRLQLLLNAYDDTIKILGALETIEEAVQWFEVNAHPDLLLLDIQLADGYSFEIFKKVNLNIPIIFTTAYNEYAIDAFKYFSIDYILKPITANALATALNKFKMIAQKPNQQQDYAMALNDIKNETYQKFKTRFLIKLGQRLFFILTTEIAYFTADNKTVHLITLDGNKYLIDYTVEKLTEILNPIYFFRANRKNIVNIEAIDIAKQYDANRLQIIIKKTNTNMDEIIVSREKVTAFKIWMDS